MQPSSAASLSIIHDDAGSYYVKLMLAMQSGGGEVWREVWHLAVVTLLATSLAAASELAQSVGAALPVHCWHFPIEGI